MNIEEILKEIKEASNPKNVMSDKEIQSIKSACEVVAKGTTLEPSAIAKLMNDDPHHIITYFGLHLAAKVVVEACGLAYDFDTKGFYDDDED